MSCHPGALLQAEMHVLRASICLLWLLAAPVAGAPARPASAAPSDEKNPGGHEAPLDEKVRPLDGRVDGLATRAFQVQVRLLDLDESVPDPVPGARGIRESESPLDRARRRYARGLERARAGDHAGAAVLLGAAIESERFRDGPDGPVALYELGEALRQQGLWATASPCYRRALERASSPRAKEALVRAVEAELQLGRPAEVPALLAAGRRAWGEAGLPPEVLYLAGKAAFRRDDLPPGDRDQEALAAFAAVPPPFEIAAAYHRGAIRVRAGDLREAVKEFEGCERLVARNPRQGAQRLQCRLALARVHGDAGNYQEATHWYGRVLRESPGLDEARYELATEYEKLGLHDAALRAIAPIQDGEPGSALGNDVEILRAQALTGLRRYPEATALYDRLRRRYLPVRDQVDAVLASERDPARHLARIAGNGSGGASPSGELPAWLLEWARASGEVGRGIDQMRRIAVAESALADAATAIERIGRRPASDGNEALRARIAEARRDVAEATADLDRLRGEVRPPVSQQAHRALEAARDELEGLLLRTDWGDVDVALARHAEARGDVRSWLYRRAAEDYWPSSVGRRRAPAESLASRTRIPDADEQKKREEAIALLGDFLRRHPEEPAYTPRALAVLAELQYESAGPDPAWSGTGARAQAAPAGDASVAPMRAR